MKSTMPAGKSYLTTTQNGRTEIPAPLISSSKLPSNGWIEWIDSDNGVVVRAAGKQGISKARGMLKGSKVSVDYFLRMKAEEQKLER